MHRSESVEQRLMALEVKATVAGDSTLLEVGRCELAAPAQPRAPMSLLHEGANEA